MADRIVVGFLTHLGLADTAEHEAYLVRVTALLAKAEAYGARPCACEARGLAFDFAADEIEEAIDFATAASRPAAGDDAAAWNVGIAQGEMHILVETGKAAAFGWGPPLVKAMALARIGRLGEVLVDPAFPRVARGEILVGDSRYGHDGHHKVRGVVVDERRIWRHDTVANLANLVRPDLVGRHADLNDILASHAALSVVRADSGCGGTRLLEEISRAVAPGRSLVLLPAGAEPLGALRRAFVRAGQGTPLAERPSRALEALRAGDGIEVPEAGALVLAWAMGPHGGSVLVDDAMEIDDPSLEAVAVAAKASPGRFRLVVRVEASSPLPAAFDGMDASPTILLGPLPRSMAEQMLCQSARSGISPEAAKRWARRGRYVPLAMTEALAEGVVSGEIAWVNDVGVPRNRRAGLGPRLGQAEWIARRLRFASESEIGVLTSVALLGTEASVALVERLALAVSPAIDVAAALRSLDEGRWLRTPADGIVALPSRSHRDAVLARIADGDRRAWHAAASTAIESGAGTLACAEAARHAALANDFPRAAAMASRAADAAAACRFGAAEEALRAFAAESASVAEPPAAAPSSHSSGGTWSDLLKNGDREGVPARFSAIASLAKGSVASALRVLENDVRATADAAPVTRSRALLAYAIGLAVAGRPTESLYQALTALARAREGNEPQGERACARFLAHLSAAVGAPAAAVTWEKVEAGRPRRP